MRAPEPSIKNKSLKSWIWDVANATTYVEGTEIAKPMSDSIDRNTKQSRTLATMRDTLLPKLLSGALSVNNELHHPRPTI